MIGAVLVHGAKAPYVVTREQLKLMKRNAVLVDVSIDQGGCFETSRPTTHTDPTYEVDGITHYCVANMPGAVPVTSTYALTNATMPYVMHARRRGRAAALRARTRGCQGRQRRRRQGHLRAGRRGDRASSTSTAGEALGDRSRPSDAGRRERGTAARRRCYPPAPHADDLPAHPQGPQPEDQEARHARPEVRQGPQEEGRRPAAARCLHPRLHDHAEEAELGAAQGRARPAHGRHGGHGLHPR